MAKMGAARGSGRGLGTGVGLRVKALGSRGSRRVLAVRVGVGQLGVWPKWGRGLQQWAWLTEPCFRPSSELIVEALLVVVVQTPCGGGVCVGGGGPLTSTVMWAMMARWCPSRVSRAIWAISLSDLPRNIWQAAASISLFCPWIFTCTQCPF